MLMHVMKKATGGRERMTDNVTARTRRISRIHRTANSPRTRMTSLRIRAI